MLLKKITFSWWPSAGPTQAGLLGRLLKRGDCGSGEAHSVALCGLLLGAIPAQGFLPAYSLEVTPGCTQRSVCGGSVQALVLPPWSFPTSHLRAHLPTGCGVAPQEFGCLGVMWREAAGRQWFRGHFSRSKTSTKYSLKSRVGLMGPCVPVRPLAGRQVFRPWGDSWGSCTCLH